jgi:putative DNA primase/helicase
VFIHDSAWKRYYRPEERDMRLQEKLDAEAPGILNWLIEGCLRWQEIALPDSVREDTQAYRHEQDVVDRFIDEECIVNEGFTSPKKTTYLYFKDWADEAGSTTQ